MEFNPVMLRDIAGDPNNWIAPVLKGLGIRVRGTASGYVGLKAPASGGALDLTLPGADGTAGQALVTNGSGALSFASVTTSPGGSNGQIQYNDAGAFAGIAGSSTSSGNLCLANNKSYQIAHTDGSSKTVVRADNANTLMLGRGGWGSLQVASGGDTTFHDGSVINTYVTIKGSGTTGAYLTSHGQLSVTAQSATTEAVKIQLASGQIANAVQVTSSGGSDGDIFRVSSAGSLYSGGTSISFPINYPTDFVIKGTAGNDPWVSFIGGGYGDVTFGSQIYPYQICNIGRFGGSYQGIGLTSGSGIGWNNHTSNCRSGFPTTSINRAADGVVEINNGTLGQYRDLNLRNLTASNTMQAVFTYGTTQVLTPNVYAGANNTTLNLTYGSINVNNLSGVKIAGHSITSASAANNVLEIAPTYNQTGTSSGVDLLINRTETSVGSGVQRLMQGNVGGATKFYVSNTGSAWFTASASTVPLTLQLASGQSANAINVTSYGGSAGDVFRVTPNGNVYCSYSIYANNAISLTHSDNVCGISIYGGTAKMLFSAESSWSMLLAAAGPRLTSGGAYQWTNGTSWGGTVDLGIMRNTSGVAEVNNGTGGQYRDLKLRSLYSVAGAATDVPVTVKLAATPTANAIEVNSLAGSGGDIFKVSATGAIYAPGSISTISALRFTPSGSWIFGDSSARVKIANYEGTEIAAIQTNAGGAGLTMLKPIGFSTTYTSLGTVAIDRDADGVLAVHNGTAGQYRDVRLRTMRSSGVIFNSTTSTPTGTTQTIDWTLGNKQVLVLSSASGDVTISCTDPAADASLRLKIVQGATARDITWPATFKWDDVYGERVWNLDANKTVFVFAEWDGTNYYASASEAYS